ncbi:MAG: sigma-70 family RNA polymerase sigma factor [Cyanobacteriota bacterium SKYGB_h_bin112]|nr:sigma-70 family RNA polymerase sigma factor [Cyanobacteriota bacterium SKYGB_h_bin112]
MTDQSPADDATLLAQIAQQNQVALSALYDRYAKLVYSLAFKSLGSVEEAEEVVLDLFAQVWRIAGRYDPAKGRADSWLLMLARSRLMDRLRALQRSHRVATASRELAKDLPAVPNNDPFNDALLSERRRQVIAALETLPTEQRLTIELAYYQGLTQQEIADQMNVSLGTVKTRIRLGLTKLRTAIGRWD